MSAAPTLTTRRTGRGRSLLSRTRSVADAAVAGAVEPDIDTGDVEYRNAHLLVNPEGTWAYYVLGEIDWHNRPQAEREGHIRNQIQRFGDLTGMLHRMWGLPLQFPIDEFRARMVADHPDAPDAPVDGASNFEDQLDRKTEYIRAMDARYLVQVLAVRVSTTRVAREHLPLLLSEDRAPDRLGTVEEVRKKLRTVTRSMSRAGFTADPVTESGLAWVLRSTRGPGLPAPPARLNRWAAHDHMHGFDEAVTATAPENGTHTTLNAIRGGRNVTSYVTVLRCRDTPEEINTEERYPWLAWFDSIGPSSDDEGAWLVQWAYTMHVRPAKEVASELAWHRRLIGSVAKHYGEHGNDEDDQHMARLRDHAADAVDETTHGRGNSTARAAGQLFVVVSAESPTVLQDAVETVIDAAAREQDILLSHVHGQWADYRRTIAGNVWDIHGHDLHLPVAYLASGVPNVTPQAGDPTGFVTGIPVGTNTVHVFNPLHGRRNGQPGVGVLAAKQGSGKTATAVAMADDLCQAGIKGVAFSPDAQIAQILGARHYQGGRGKVIPLTRVTTPGVAMPSLMVPVPTRDPKETEEEYDGRVADATASRMKYERDILTALLPGDMQRAGIGVSAEIQKAVAASEGQYGVSPWEHVAALRKAKSQVAHDVADQLESQALLPSGRLVFPDKRDDADVALARIRDLMETDALFTCVTAPGLDLPQTPDRSTWSDDNYESIPVIMSGLRLSSLSLFSDRNPGWYIADEVDIATGGATQFRTFLMQLIYDIRRFDKWAGLLVKSMSTLEGLDPKVASLLGWAGIGRMGADGAEACIPVLGADVDPTEIITEVPHLDDGEWYWRGWDGRVRRIPFDQSWWHPDVIKYTDTKHGTRPERLAATIKSW